MIRPKALCPLYKIEHALHQSMTLAPCGGLLPNNLHDEPSSDLHLHPRNARDIDPINRTDPG
jgi:hypothetical protein